MKVKVRASLMVSEERSEYELPEGTTAGEVLETVRSKHPEAGDMKNVLISRNGKRSSRAELLSDGDELELILLMGGG